LDWIAVPALVAAVLMISKGADWLTDSVWDISVRRRVSAGMLGMVVAGLMTTLPEVTVSSMASALRSGGLSVGNAIGSTIFNVLGIVGVIGLIRPLNFERSFLKDYGRVALLDYLLFYVLVVIGGSLNRIDAVIMFLVLILSLYYGYRRRYVGAPSLEAPQGSTRRDIAVLLGGAAVLGTGSYLLVISARIIASSLGIPEVVIGLSLVAVGTSIPELATGIASTRKGIEEISVGNILGANIYNVTLVLGCAALVGGLLHGDTLVAQRTTLLIDIPVMIGALLLLMAVGKDGRIARRTSVLFLLIYAVYLLATFLGPGAAAA
jgi:cation:H+ antiporter